MKEYLQYIRKFIWSSVKPSARKWFWVIVVAAALAFLVLFGILRYKMKFSVADSGYIGWLFTARAVIIALISTAASPVEFLNIPAGEFPFHFRTLEHLAVAGETYSSGIAVPTVISTVRMIAAVLIRAIITALAVNSHPIYPESATENSIL